MVSVVDFGSVSHHELSKHQRNESVCRFHFESGRKIRRTHSKTFHFIRILFAGGIITRYAVIIVELDAQFLCDNQELAVTSF